MVLDYAGMREDFLIADEDELDVVLTRATSRHVRSLLVAGRELVSDGALTGLDLGDAERELMKRVRRMAAMDAGQSGRHRRRRDAVRAYYSDDSHHCRHVT